MKHFLSPLLFVLILVSCCKQDDLGLSSQRIRFDQMEIGQKSRYLRFQAGLCGESDNGFRYLGDTLVLELIAANADTFVFKEYLTAGSFSVKQPGASLALFFTGEIQGNILLKSGKLLAFDRAGSAHSSRLFSDLSFPLANIEQPRLELNTWYPEVENDPTHQGYLKNYDQNGIEYPRLNYVLDYTPMQADGPGNFYFYTAEYGIVRSGARNGWCTDKGSGWDLLPE